MLIINDKSNDDILEDFTSAKNSNGQFDLNYSNFLPQIWLQDAAKAFSDMAAANTPSSGDDVINAGFLTTALDGGAGTDHLTLNYSGTGIVNGSAVTATSINLRLNNSSTDESISHTGGSLSFDINGFEAFDITATSGNDTISSADGDDIIHGLGGDDTLEGGGGSDQLFGGDGNDMLTGGYFNPSASVLDGGADDDVISSYNVGDTVQGGTGFDVVFINYSASSTDLDFSLGNSSGPLANIEQIYGTFTNGNNIVEAGFQTRAIDGAGGTDHLTLDYSGTGIVNGAAVTATSINLRLNNSSTDESITHSGGSLSFDINGFEAFDITATSGNDTISSADGDDIIHGLGGDDTLNGGGGNDTLEGGEGADILNGGAGDFDVATYAGSAARVIANLFTGTGSGVGSDASGDTYVDIEGLIGSDYNDILVGRDGASDTLRGGDGNDSLRANGADDFVYGEGGNDLIFAGFGADTIDGGDGIDTLMLTNASAGAIIRLDLGTGSFNVAQGDTYTNIENVAGSAFRDLLYGDDGINFLDGRGGNDLLIGNGGADTLDGGDGFDTVSYANSASGITASLASGTGPGSDIIREVEHLVGSAFGDFLYGDDNVNLLEGGAGNDLLVGNGGADTLNGGDGFDTVSYATSASGITASLFLGTGPGGDIIQNVEHLIGSSFNDLLVGNDGADETLDGGGGADSLRGNGGNDILNGGGGNDILFSGFGNDAHDGGGGFDTINYSQASAGVIVRLDLGTGSLGHAQGDTYANIENITGSSAFRDLLYGNDIGNIIDGRGGNDLLIGNGGSDTLIGGNGFDKLDGGTGFDVLTGGAGDDIFVFEAGYQADRITDFTIGEDQVDLTSFGFTTYSQVSSLMYTDGADTVLTFGGGDAIRLVGISLGDLSASDFILTAPPGNAPAEKAAFAPANDSFDFRDDFDAQDQSMAFMQQELIAEFAASAAMHVPFHKSNDFNPLEASYEDDLSYDFSEWIV